MGVERATIIAEECLKLHAIIIPPLDRIALLYELRDRIIDNLLQLRITLQHLLEKLTVGHLGSIGLGGLTDFHGRNHRERGG